VRKSSSLPLISGTGKTRQAPYYYEPYFGYLLCFIMSYAFHVDLVNQLNDDSLS
jgi:hypothetical protein